MSKILKVGDKAYNDTNWGTQVITVERVTEKTAFWSHGLRSKIDDSTVKDGNGNWATFYTVPQTEDQEAYYTDKIALRKMRSKASAATDKISKAIKEMNIEQLEKLINLYEGFEL